MTHRFWNRRAFLAAAATGVACWPGVALARDVSLRGKPRPQAEAAASLPPENDFIEPDSSFFSTAYAEYSATRSTASTGDLWPSCWADDGELYTANGDGQGFGNGPFADLVVNRLSGTPETGLSGTRLAAGPAVARIYADPALYNRKPTGMLAVDGNGDGHDELYLAVQDLRYAPEAQAFDDAPNASICVSTDHGRTWTSTAEPMFGGHVFTTIMFLDFGRSNQQARALGADGAGYAYAYGLDNNWRDSFSNTVPSPTGLYLARVPIGQIQRRQAWQFYSGSGGNGAPQWSANIADRAPVLRNSRTIYPTLQRTTPPNAGPADLSMLSMGGITYNPGLRRYLYTSWTEYTFEFYEAPQPWGPWRLFMTKDFGGYPWFGTAAARVTRTPTRLGHVVPRVSPRAAPATPGPKNGGYGCTLPSKFISADGRSMWLQSNWFVGVGSGAPNYSFSLRRLVLRPHQAGTPANPANATVNLARSGEGVVPIEKSAHYGNGAYYNDGDLTRNEDSWDNSFKTTDFWGYCWTRPYNVNRVVYTTGQMYPDGGWFGSGVNVQVRQNFVWVTVAGLSTTPAYPKSMAAGPNKRYTLRFADTWGDGIRIIGAPGGAGHFTSIAELEVYYDPR